MDRKFEPHQNILLRVVDPGCLRTVRDVDRDLIARAPVMGVVLVVRIDVVDRTPAEQACPIQIAEADDLYFGNLKLHCLPPRS